MFLNCNLLKTQKSHCSIIKKFSKFFNISLTDTSFTTMHLYKNMKPNLSNVVIFISIEHNGRPNI